MTLGRLLLLFTVVPLGELLILVEIGERIGAGPTVLIVLATGVLGAWLARREGTRSLRVIQERLSAGSLPARELFHGLLILLAGAFLVTPGVVTDAVGFTLLIRPARDRIIDALRRRLEDRMARGQGGYGEWADGEGVYFSFGSMRGGTADSTSDDGGREGQSGRTRERKDEGGRVIEI